MRRPRRADRGAVAIIVSVTVVAVLIPTSALAVDLGSVYVRTASLQDAADNAARAGAIELARQQNAGASAGQATDAARTAAVEVLCQDPSLNRDSDGDGIGDGSWGTLCAGGNAWASDDNPSNGEVQFYNGAPSAEHTYSTSQLADGVSLVTGIRVLTPPSRVEYGLASAIPGQPDHTDPQRSATAALSTVLPAFGFLPLFTVAGQSGGLCFRDAPKPASEARGPQGVCQTAAKVTRGYLSVARTAAGQAPAVDWNTAQGIDPDHLPLPGQTATVSTPAPVNDLAAGLFGSASGFSGAGRLTTTSCPFAVATVAGTHDGVEGTYLSSFVDTQLGSVDQLRAEVLAGTPATAGQSGWLSSGILRCGRLALLPDLAVSSMPTNGLAAGSYPVDGWRLLWIDSRLDPSDTTGEQLATGTCVQRGLVWLSPTTTTGGSTGVTPFNPFSSRTFRGSRSGGCNSPTSSTTLGALTGYLLDPHLLPAVVSGPDAANQVNYLGGDLPATVRLIRDASDPPAG